jgi:hypothetical protein
VEPDGQVDEVGIELASGFCELPLSAARRLEVRGHGTGIAEDARDGGLAAGLGR